MTTEVSQAKIVMMAVQYGDQILEMGAVDEAQTNFTTAVSLNAPFVNELLSDNPEVAAEAASRKLPPGIDLLTYTTSPLSRLYRLLRRRGDAETAFQVAQMAAALYARLAPYSAAAAEFLDELADLAFQVGDQDYSRQSSEQAARIRRFLATGGD